MTWVARAIRSSGGVARPRSVAFSSSTTHDRDEIWVAKGRCRAGDGDGPDRRRPRQPRAPHQKPHSAPATSRKTALCNQSLTENRTLAQPPHQKAHSGSCGSRKSALCVCLLTEKRILPRRLTKNRTLAQQPHGKAHSATSASRKSAVWLVRGSQNAPFREDPCPECAFP